MKALTYANRPKALKYVEWMMGMKTVYAGCGAYLGLIRLRIKGFTVSRSTLKEAVAEATKHLGKCDEVLVTGSNGTSIYKWHLTEHRHVTLTGLIDGPLYVTLVDQEMI